MAATNRQVWQRGTAIEADDVAAGIRRIVLEVSKPAPAEPGAHVDIEVPIDGRIDTRSYSVVESIGGGKALAISVQLAARSRGGSAYMHRLAVGDALTMTQPLQNFPLRVGAPRYLLVAGGIGVTALVSMAATLRRLGADYRLVYAGRTRSAMAYLDRLVAGHGQNIAVHVDDEGSSLDVDELVGGIQNGTELYVCGPIGLMDAVRRSWAAGGHPNTRLRFETFGNSGMFEAAEFLVKVPRLQVETRVGAEQTMLSALQDAGVDVMFDCRKGECGLCEVTILGVDGSVDHRDVFYSQRQRRASQRMCCCVSRITRSDGQAGLPAVTIDVS
jgi:vanillate O-demethylase ferredoxin subunit